MFLATGHRYQHWVKPPPFGQSRASRSVSEGTTMAATADDPTSTATPRSVPSSTPTSPGSGEGICPRALAPPRSVGHVRDFFHAIAPMIIDVAVGEIYFTEDGSGVAARATSRSHNHCACCESWTATTSTQATTWSRKRITSTPDPLSPYQAHRDARGRPQDLVTQQDEVVVDVVDRATLCAADAERDAEVAVRVRRQRVGGHVEQVVRCGPPVED